MVLYSVGLLGNSGFISNKDLYISRFRRALRLKEKRLLRSFFAKFFLEFQ